MYVCGSYRCTWSGGCGVAAQSAAPGFQFTSNDPGTAWHHACSPHSSKATADTVFML
jgi:hypothetical protein